jgi:mRNA-degrading endonuclease RelE of RelBE toxin-antitoxin system
MPNNPSVSIIASPEFLRRLKALAKRYRQVRSDIQPILDNLQLGIFPGEQIQGTPYTALKLRTQLELETLIIQTVKPRYNSKIRAEE